MKKTAIILSLAAILCGCNSFLDVNPKGEVFNNDMFTSAAGYEDALYGIYAELGTVTGLYSDYLYWIPEALSANVSISDNGLQYMALAQWSAFNASTIRTNVWKAAYSVINHTNNILDHIAAGGDDQFPHTKIYKGEALALRALLHFEMLRLFGAPWWASAADKARAIPYADKYSFSISPFRSVDETYQLILDDLKAAEQLLGEDAELIPVQRDNSSGGGFTSCRIIHLNLYAVQALMARVYWSKGDLDNAAIQARKVIDSGKFTFRDKSAFVQYDNGTLDLKETIFGIFSQSSNEKNAKKYGLTSSGSSFVLSPTWKALYNDGSASAGSDWRETAWFDGAHLRALVNSSFIGGTNTYSGPGILGINVLRISEMYYIVAEQLLGSDPDEATRFFDEAVSTRGLDKLADKSLTLTADILFAERRKEFYGEGLHWHDCKRLGKDIQADATTVLSGTDVNTYKLPLPTSEEANREER